MAALEGTLLGPELEHAQQVGRIGPFNNTPLSLSFFERSKARLRKCMIQVSAGHCLHNHAHESSKYLEPWQCDARANNVTVHLIKHACEACFIR